MSDLGADASHANRPNTSQHPNPDARQDAPQDLGGNLRQMIAVLEAERQALATLQADGLLAVTRQKDELCNRLAQFGEGTLDPETRALAQTAKSLNDANRRVRNLLAANVSRRLDAFGGDPQGQPAYTAQGL